MFNGNIRVVHMEVFIKSLRNKLKHVTDLKCTKDIRYNIMENVSGWFTSIKGKIENLKHFYVQFLYYYWG